MMSHAGHISQNTRIIVKADDGIRQHNFRSDANSPAELAAEVVLPALPRCERRCPAAVQVVVREVVLMLLAPPADFCGDAAAAGWPGRQPLLRSRWVRLWPGAWPLCEAAPAELLLAASRLLLAAAPLSG